MSDDAPASVAPADKDPEQQASDAMAVDDASAPPTGDKAKADDDKTNEDTQVNGNSAPAAEKDAGEDAEMTGTAETGAEDDDKEANGTPATAQKPRRKSAGIPEHKTKKTLKHKKSVKEFHTNAKPGELYLARMKGHPNWPSIIADDDMLPEVIAGKRPVTAPNPDGTWRRPEYAPDGKRHNERTFPIMFLSTNEFAWLPNSDLIPLTVEDCKDVSEKSKGKTLLAAYAEAAEGHPLSHYKGLLNDHADAVAEEEAAQAEREAEKARKAEKKAKRKSDVTAKVDDDEMDVDDDGAETKPKSKKRKKDAGDADENEKPAKTPKTTKLKLTTPKTPGPSEKSAKKKDTGTKAANKKRAPAKVAESDEADTPVPEKEPTAQEKFAKREQEVKYCRHKLQRGLLTRDNVPSDEEVKAMSGWLQKLENYPELEASIIRSTKIHKVLKAMIKLASIPHDEEYGFKKRSMELLAKWNKVLADSPNAGDDKADEKADDKPDAPVVNGDAKTAAKSSVGQAKSENKTEEKGEDKVEADSAAIDTGVEGEKEAEVGDNAAAKLAADAETDEPDISKAPAEEYKPPVDTAEVTASS